MKNKIIRILKEAGLYSAVYRDRVANEAMEIIGNETIEPVKFDSWLKELNFKGQNIRTYFLGCLKNAVTQGLLVSSVSSTVSQTNQPKHAGPIEVEDEEEVKRQAEEWIDLVFELDDDFPSGIYYDAAGKRRGYFDGAGGFVYEGNGQ